MKKLLLVSTVLFGFTFVDAQASVVSVNGTAVSQTQVNTSEYNAAQDYSLMYFNGNPYFDYNDYLGGE